MITVEMGRDAAGKCPFEITAKGEIASNQYWWPERLNLQVLRRNSPASDP